MIAPRNLPGLAAHLARLCRDVAEALGSRRYVGALTPSGSDSTGALLLDAKGLSLELVLSVFDSRAGSGATGPTMLRLGALGRGENALHKAMEACEVEGLWAVPLAASGRAVGMFCFETRADPDAQPAWLVPEDPFWQMVTGAVEETSTRALSACLRVAAGVQGPQLREGAAAVLCADLEQRVLYASAPASSLLHCRVDAFEVLDPEATITGTLRAASPDEPVLMWQTLQIGTGAKGSEVEAAIAAPRGPSPALGPARVALVRGSSSAEAGGGIRDIVPALAEELHEGISRLRARGQAAAQYRESRGGRLFQELRAALLASVEESVRAGVQTRALLGLAGNGTDLNALLEDVSAEVEPALELRSIRVFKFLPPELPRIEVDAFELRAVFRSLFEVSSRALERGGGAVTFRSWEEDGYVYGSIADDGPGLADSDVAVLFTGGLEPHRAALAEARDTVARIGGRIEVESRPGLWTRFTVLLPTQPSLKQSPKVHDLPPSIQVTTDRNGLAVLVVDDNTQLRSVVKRFLERRGHSVTEAADGLEALELLVGADFDRVLVDLNMPGKCGKEFYQELEDVAPRMRERTIFMSGAFHEGGVDDFVVESGRPAVHKPFDLVDMARTVEE